MERQNHLMHSKCTKSEAENHYQALTLLYVEYAVEMCMRLLCQLHSGLCTLDASMSIIKRCEFASLDHFFFAYIK